MTYGEAIRSEKFRAYLKDRFNNESQSEISRHNKHLLEADAEERFHKQKHVQVEDVIPEEDLIYIERSEYDQLKERAEKLEHENRVRTRKISANNLDIEIKDRKITELDDKLNDLIKTIDGTKIDE